METEGASVPSDSRGSVVRDVTQLHVPTRLGPPDQPTLPDA